MLNPNAWAPCPTNSTCASTAVLYKDFRGPRNPSENANIGRHFRVGKEGKYDFYIRGEFVNIFNRTLIATPTGFYFKSAEPTGERRRRRHHLHQRVRSLEQRLPDAEHSVRQSWPDRER